MNAGQCSLHKTSTKYKPMPERKIAYLLVLTKYETANTLCTFRNNGKLKQRTRQSCCTMQHEPIQNSQRTGQRPAQEQDNLVSIKRTYRFKPTVKEIEQHLCNETEHNCFRQEPSVHVSITRGYCTQIVESAIE